MTPRTISIPADGERWPRRRSRLRGPALAIGALSLLLAADASAESWLVRMRNGRVLRVESYEEEGGWLMATLEGEGEGESVIGFPLDVVESVEVDPRPGSAGDGEDPANVVTSGRYIPPRGGLASRGSAIQNRRPPRDPRANAAAGQSAAGKEDDPGKPPGR